MINECTKALIAERDEMKAAKEAGTEDERSKGKLMSVDVTLDSVTVNARELVFKVEAITALHAKMNQYATPEARLGFRIRHKKPTKWTVPWDELEDGMLLVGIYRHGYGSWEAIRDDPDLQLSGKIGSKTNKDLPRGEKLSRRA